VGRDGDAQFDHSSMTFNAKTYVCEAVTPVSVKLVLPIGAPPLTVSLRRLL
jgi:hypothetical protein